LNFDDLSIINLLFPLDTPDFGSHFSFLGTFDGQFCLLSCDSPCTQSFLLYTEPSTRTRLTYVISLSRQEWSFGSWGPVCPCLQTFLSFCFKTLLHWAVITFFSFWRSLSLTTVLSKS
jgi:hypothetical protein